MKINIKTEPGSDNYTSLHIATFFLIAFSFFMVIDKIPAPVRFIFVGFLCLSFYISWRYKEISLEKFELMEYALIFFYVIVVIAIVSNAGFEWEKIILASLNIILITEIYMSFYLLWRRRYIFLQAMSLLIFLISAIFVTEKTVAYFSFAFLYIATWFFIFRSSFLKEAKEHAFQIISGTEGHKKYRGWVGIIGLFFIVSIGAIVITKGIIGLEPYKIGIFPSRISQEIGDTIDEDSKVGYMSLEELESQKFQKLITTFDNITPLADEDKAYLLSSLSKLFDKNMPIQKILKVLLDLIDILKRQGPGSEPEYKEKMAGVLSFLDSYSEVKVKLSLQRSKESFSRNMRDKSYPEGKRGKFKEILNKIDQAKAIDAIDKFLTELEEAQPSWEKDNLALELYQTGLAKAAEIYIEERGGLEDITGAVKEFKDLKIPISPKFFKEALSLDHNLNKIKLPKEQQSQIEKLKQEIFEAKTADELKESKAFFLIYIQRLKESGKIPETAYQAIRNSIEEFAEAKEKVIGRAKKLSSQIESSAEKQLVSIDISPSNQEVALGKEASFKATGTYSDSTKRDISKLTDWTVSEPEIASSHGGRFSSLSIGTTYITAVSPEGISNQATLVVTEPRLASIKIEPASPIVSLGDDIQLKAIGGYSDLRTKDLTTEVSWSVDNENVCSISGAGYIKAHRLGKANILVNYQDIESLPCMLEVVPVVMTLRLLILIFSLLLILAVVIFILVIYIKNKANIKRLEKIEQEEPRRYIITLYRYLNRILDKYGIKRNKSVPPKTYIKQIDKQPHKALIIPLVDLTESFYIARYSNLNIKPQSSLKANRDYNRILQIVSSSELLWKNLFVKLCGFIRIIPFSL